MAIFEDLADEIFRILKSRNYKLSLFNEEGTKIYKPEEARKFFASPSNLVVSINKDGLDSSVSLYLSKDVDIKDAGIIDLIDTLRNTSTKHGIILNVRKYAKELKKSDFAVQAKIREDVKMDVINEDIQTEIGQKIGRFAKDRKASNWNQVASSVSATQIQSILGDLYKDLEYIDSGDLYVSSIQHGEPKPCDFFHCEYNVPQVFILENTYGLFLVNTEGYNYAKYVCKLIDDIQEENELSESFAVGAKVKKTMGVKLSGSVIKPFTWYKQDDGGYSEPKKGDIPVKWSDGTKGYIAPRFLEIEESLTESKSLPPSFGGKKTSYQKIGESKLIIRHSAPVKEGVFGSRGRNISSIFIETSLGERFLYPHSHLSGARAMAKHISEGGKLKDKLGRHIIGLSEEYKNLSDIAGYVYKNRINLDEGALVIRESLRDRAKNIRSELGRVVGSYTKFTENFNPTKTLVEGTNDEVLRLATILKLSESDSIYKALKFAAPYTNKLNEAEVAPAMEPKKNPFTEYATQWVEKIARNSGKLGDVDVADRTVKASRVGSDASKVKPVGNDVITKVIDNKKRYNTHEKGQNDELSEDIADLAEGFKLISKGQLKSVAPKLSKVVKFRTPEDEYRIKLALWLKPDPNIKPMVSMFISTLTDKLSDGKKLSNNEKFFADKLVGAVTLEEGIREMHNLSKWFEQFDPLSVLKESDFETNSGINLVLSLMNDMDEHDKEMIGGPEEIVNYCIDNARKISMREGTLWNGINDEEFEYLCGFVEGFSDGMDDMMDGDHESALASAGFGTDEDYGYNGFDESFDAIVNNIINENECEYENVVFLQDHQAEEFFNILDDEGEHAALEYLKQWHYPGEHVCSNELGHGSTDDIYEETDEDGGEYIMTYNRSLGYAGLQYKSNIMEGKTYRANDDDEENVKTKKKMSNRPPAPWWFPNASPHKAEKAKAKKRQGLPAEEDLNEWSEEPTTNWTDEASKKSIAMQTLRLTDEQVGLIGLGMSKTQARQYLKSIGQTPEEIAKLEEDSTEDAHNDVMTLKSKRQEHQKKTNKKLGIEEDEDDPIGGDQDDSLKKEIKMNKTGSPQDHKPDNENEIEADEYYGGLDEDSNDPEYNALANLRRLSGI